MRIIRLTSSVLVLMLLTGFIYSIENQNDDELLKMSVADLMKIEVVTSSKKIESEFDAPGIVTVIREEAIDTYGGNSLGELLERVAGIYMTGSHIYPDNKASVRGGLGTTIDNQVLILINGRPLRESLFGGRNFSVYRSFPLSVIQRVEVVRGPGSVLYGTNAYLGIINIITKKRNLESFGIKGALKRGSNDTSIADMTMGFSKGKLNVTGALRYKNSDGWELEAVDENGVSGKENLDNMDLGAFISIDYGDLKINSAFLNSRQYHFGPAPDWNAGMRNIDLTSFLGDIGYDIRVSKSWECKLNLTYNSMVLEFLNPIGDYRGKTHDVFGEMVHNVKVSKSVDILAGVSGYFMSGSGASITESGEKVDVIRPYSENWLSFFIQGDLKINKHIKLILGGQLNKAGTQKTRFLPRTGLIWRLNKKLGVKALYSHAFRSPFAGERYIAVGGALLGNEDLTPETISTVDLQLFYITERAKFSLTWFRSWQNDLIKRVPMAGYNSTLTYDNSGELNMKGIEFEGEVFVSEAIGISSSFNWQKNRRDGVDNYSTIPSFMLKSGFTFKPVKGLRAGVFHIFYSEPEAASTRNPYVKEVNPAAGSVNLLSLNCVFDIGDYVKALKGISFGIYGYNLLNEDVWFTEFNRSRINTLPLKGGRSIYMSFMFHL